MAELTPQEKIALIKQNLQEVLKEDILEDIIIKQNRPLVIYLGKYSITHSRGTQSTTVLSPSNLTI
jgi:hypothetical protein